MTSAAIVYELSLATIRTRTPPSLRMIWDRAKAGPQTSSSKAGAGVSRQTIPESTMARAQSMQGKNVEVIWPPAVAIPRRAASKIA